jgi:hypothetical protein
MSTASYYRDLTRMSHVGTSRNWRLRKNRSRPGDSRHGRTHRGLGPVVNDPLQIWLWSKYAAPQGGLLPIGAAYRGNRPV